MKTIDMLQIICASLIVAVVLAFPILLIWWSFVITPLFIFGFAMWLLIPIRTLPPFIRGFKHE